jgi:curved DNA-binding protein CbpA
VADEVDLSEEFRQDLREFAERLPSLNYYEVLGVPWHADRQAIREAFFQRSKTYHPDRFFGKRLGVYEAILLEIFKRVAAAHEVPRDPELRTQYDRSLGYASRHAAPSGTRRLKGLPGAPERSGRSLRQRRGLRPPDFALRGLEMRIRLARQKAAGVFADGKALEKREEWERAAAKLRLAVALDPREEKYQSALANVVPRANEACAVRLIEEAAKLLKNLRVEPALEKLEAAAELRPTDHALASRIAELRLEGRGDVGGAIEYAQRAVEVEGSIPAYRMLLGRLYKAAKRPDEARQQFERAMVLDPEDKAVKAELRAL